MLPTVLFKSAFIMEETKNAVAEPNTTYQEPLNVLFKV
jgi:hypothetical protein